MAGIATLTCIEVRGEMTADEILEDQLLENLQREDLKPVEQARAWSETGDPEDRAEVAEVEPAKPAIS